MKRLFIVCACVAVVCLALVGCGGGSNLTNFGWISFEMPQGFEDTHEQDTYITIANTEDSDQTIKVDNDTTTFNANADAAADARVAMSPDSYTKGEAFTMGGYEWTPVGFTFNDKPSAFYYADISPDHTMCVSAFAMTESDEPVMTVLSTIEVDESQIS